MQAAIRVELGKIARGVSTGIITRAGCSDCRPELRCAPCAECTCGSVKRVTEFSYSALVLVVHSRMALAVGCVVLVKYSLFSRVLWHERLIPGILLERHWYVILMLNSNVLRDIRPIGTFGWIPFGLHD